MSGERSFNLWNPVLAPDRAGCHFDVTRASLKHIASGSRELIDGFLTALSIDGGCASWTVHPFCSPYYADEDAVDLRDRFRMAWRIAVRLSRPHSGDPPPLRFVPIVAGGHDPTWAPTGNPSAEDRACVLIANFVDVPQSRVDMLAESLETPAEHAHLHTRIIQSRFDLGVVHLPGDEPRISDRVASISRVTPYLSWSCSIRLVEIVTRGHL